MRKSLLIFSVTALTVFGLKKYSAPLLSIQKYNCIQTGLLADDYFASITTQVHTLLDQDCSAPSLITYLKKEYPVLNKIIVAYRPYSTYVMMYTHKPMCCINDDVMLTKNHQLFQKDFFAQHALDSVAHISVAHEYISKTPSFVPPLLHDLPSDFNETYDITLLNEHCVRLTDKQDKNFTIISSIGQKKLPSLLAHCKSVKKIMRERKDFDKSKWITDIRFADYIIAHKV